MTSHPFNALQVFLLAVFALIPTAGVLAHSGHGAPDVHAHAGSPSLLAVLAVITLGIAALAALARLVLRLNRRRHPR